MDEDVDSAEFTWTNVVNSTAPESLVGQNTDAPTQFRSKAVMTQYSATIVE